MISYNDMVCNSNESVTQPHYSEDGLDAAIEFQYMQHIRPTHKAFETWVPLITLMRGKVPSIHEWTYTCPATGKPDQRWENNLIEIWFVDYKNAEVTSFRMMSLFITAPIFYRWKSITVFYFLFICGKNIGPYKVLMTLFGFCGSKSHNSPCIPSSRQ